MTALAATAEDPRDCWRTPRKLFAGLNDRYQFDVDAAADHANALLPNFWTAEQNGVEMLSLLKHTHLRAWCNPPYSEIGPWVARACSRALFGGFTALLLPANRTQMRWWHEYAMQGELWFFKGRIAFEPPPGIAPSTPRGNSVLVVFDPYTIKQKIVGSLDPLTGKPPASPWLSVATEGE